jgi:SsrA-binding protein
MPSLKNHKAYKNFNIEEEYEAGIKLTGTEVKSLRDGRGSIKGAYAKVEEEEAFLYGMTIPKYSHASEFHNHDPERPRKLLLHKNQIRRLIGATARKGYTLNALKLYFQNGYAKIRIGLSERLNRQDKRDDIKKQEAEREMRREMKKHRPS